MGLGAGLALTGSIGLLRPRGFDQRPHAPMPGATLGIGCILFASMLFFSVAQGRFVLHENMLLARAALHRDRAEGSAEVPPPFQDEPRPVPARSRVSARTQSRKASAEGRGTPGGSSSQ